VLEIDDLTVKYDAAVALDGVSLSVAKGEMVALIGANGAGKSTLVSTLSGLLRPAGGRFSIAGTFAQVPEGRQLFPGLTAEDNVRLGGWKRGSRDPEFVYEVMPELRDIRHRLAGTLSGGQQQMVAVARALMSRPDVLAIDELSLGLAPIVVGKLLDHLRRLNASSALTVLLIEQNARLALGLCSRGYVLESGRIVGEGSSSELLASDVVSRAYLGSGEGRDAR
jgi:branched-chain amino acid transport system ATP-binding protein